jgi:hypothetical protein
MWCSLFTFVLVLACSFPVYAQETASSASLLGDELMEKRLEYESLKDRVGERRDVFIEKYASTSADLERKKAERREMMFVRAKSRLQNLFLNVRERGEAAIARLDAILLRVESRAEKFALGGQDVSTARAHLALAKGSLARARDISRELGTLQVVEIVGTGSPREKFRIVREKVVALKDALVSTRESLRAAVLALTESALPKSPQVGDVASTTMTEGNQTR